jgi:hypothetical protein
LAKSIVGPFLQASIRRDTNRDFHKVRARKSRLRNQPFNPGTPNAGVGHWKTRGEMSVVSHLRIAEDVRIEAEAFHLLQASLGRDASGSVVERVVIEITEKMGAAEQAHAIADFESLTRTARALCAISEQLGFGLLAKVAQDLRHCAQRRDPVALAAVLHRLLRVGDASLSAAIEGEGL